MKDEKMSNYKKFTKWVYTHLVVVFIANSLILIAISHLGIVKNPNWNEIIRNFGYAIFSSGVFAAVLKSIQFVGIFKQEIEKVMLGKDFIKNINIDRVNELWKDVSKTIYNRKFPSISNELEDRILETYFPTNTDYYYEDFIVTIKIHELTDDLRIKYTQSSKFKVILDESIDKTTLVFTSTVDKMDGDSNIVNELDYFKVDGNNVNVKDNEIVSDNKFDMEYSVELKGKNSYNVSSKYKREYSLKEENYKLFRVRTFTKNMEVVISYPEDVVVSFFNIGNVNKFEKQHVEVENQICRSHKNDVLLPQQGFGLSFNKK